MKTVSAQRFNQNPAAVKRMATVEPVKITERGWASHVLLSISEYDRITGKSLNIADMLAREEAIDIEFEQFDSSKR